MNRYVVEMYTFQRLDIASMRGAVLAANAKVDGEGQISHPHPTKTP